MPKTRYSIYLEINLDLQEIRGSLGSILAVVANCPIDLLALELQNRDQLTNGSKELEHTWSAISVLRDGIDCFLNSASR